VLSRVGLLRIACVSMLLFACVNGIAQEPKDPVKPQSSMFEQWFHRHYTKETRDQLKAALEQKRESLGADHPDTLNALEDFTSACAKLCDVEKLIANREEVFEKRTKVLGEDHPETLKAMGLLADACTSEGQYPRGLAIADDLLERFRRILGQDHFETLVWSRIVALYSGEAGNLAKSRELVKAALAKQIKHLGETHPETLRTKLLHSRNLAADFELKAALDLRLKVHEEHLKSLGPKHPECIDSMFWLAKGYAQNGDYGNAMAIAQEANQLASKTFPTESDAMSVLTDVAMVLREAGFVLNAEQALTREKELRTKLQGAEHPKTLLVRLELAKIRFIKGEVEEAKTEIEFALDKLRTMLTPSDIRIWNGEIALANILLQQRDPAGITKIKELLDRSPFDGEVAKVIQSARRDVLLSKAAANEGSEADLQAVLQKSYDQISSKLGEDHPQSLAARADLATNLARQGETAKAIESYEALLKKMEQKLGRMHTETISVLENLGMAYMASSQTEKGLRTLTVAAQARAQTLGQDCPRALRAFIELARVFRSLRRFDVSVNILEQVHSRQKDRFPIDSKERIDTAILLAGGYLQLGRAQDAIQIYKATYEHFLKTKGPKDDQTLMFQGGLSEAYLAAGSKEEGLKQLELLIGASREVNAAEPLKIAETLKRIALELNKYDLAELAEKHFRESLEIADANGGDQWEKVFVSVQLARTLTNLAKFEEAEKRLTENYDLADKERAMLPKQHQFLPTLCADSLRELYSKKGDATNTAKWLATFNEELERSKPK
jgi:hypothetical protein